MMDDAELLNKLMDGDANPDLAEHEQELVNRALQGSKLCRRIAFRVLWSQWMAGNIATPEYMARTEMIATPGAKSGDEESIIRLGGVWGLRAYDLRSDGFHEAAHRLEVETMVMIGRLANGGSDRAVAELNEMRGQMSAEAVAEADAELWCDGLSIEPQPEPEVLQALARAEAAMGLWGLSDDDTPPTIH